MCHLWSSVPKSEAQRSDWNSDAQDQFNKSDTDSHPHTILSDAEVMPAPRRLGVEEPWSGVNPREAQTMLWVFLTTAWLPPPPPPCEIPAVAIRH